jgi:serine/threonine protein kinase
VINVDNKKNVKDFYDFGEVLGSGGFATVYLATSRTSWKQVALKKIIKKSLNQLVLVHLQREIHILRKMDHPNVIKFIDYFEDEKHCWIVTEYADGGELFRRLAVDKVCYDECEARILAEEILNGIKYCHDRKVVHRYARRTFLAVISFN